MARETKAQAEARSLRAEEHSSALQAGGRMEVWVDRPSVGGMPIATSLRVGSAYVGLRLGAMRIEGITNEFSGQLTLHLAGCRLEKLTETSFVLRPDTQEKEN